MRTCARLIVPAAALGLAGVSAIGAGEGATPHGDGGGEVPIAAAATAGGDDCAGFPCGDNGEKVMICHAPPGNPENAHTLCVGAPAAPAHLANHPDDMCGPCPDGPAGVTHEGDLGHDDHVGVEDFLLLMADWGSCPEKPAACPADFDGDDVVGVNDFLILLMNWG